MKRSDEVPTDGQRFVLYTILDGHLAAEQLVRGDGDRFPVSQPVRPGLLGADARRRRAPCRWPRDGHGKSFARFRFPPRITSRDLETSQIVEQLGPLYLALGDVDAALEIARRSRGIGSLPGGVRMAGTYQLKKGNASAASAILQEALEAARDTGPQGDGVSVHRPTSWRWRGLSKLTSTAAIWTGRSAVLRQMSNGYRKVEAFRAIATAQAKARHEAAAVPR